MTYLQRSQLLLVKKQSGMSLIQVIIALGLMSVISLGIAELMVTSTKVTQRYEIKISQLLLINDFQSISSNAAACTQAVGPPINQTFNATQAASANGLDIKFNVAGDIIESDQPITNGLSVERLFFKIPSATPITSTATENIYLGKVYINFNVTEGVVGGGLKQKELGSFYLRERINDSIIIGCEKEALVPISDVCINNFDGSFDPETQKCTLPFSSTSEPNGQECTPGDTKSEPCPPPYSTGYYNYVCVDGYWIGINSSCMVLGG